MPKLLTRIVALALAGCLIADPATVSAFPSAPTPATHWSVPTDLFRRQALEPFGVPFMRQPMAEMPIFTRRWVRPLHRFKRTWQRIKGSAPRAMRWATVPAAALGVALYQTAATATAHAATAAATTSNFISWGALDISIKSGDSLSKISNLFHLRNWNVLHAANPSIANPNVIFAGHQLSVPGVLPSISVSDAPLGQIGTSVPLPDLSTLTAAPSSFSHAIHTIPQAIHSAFQSSPEAFLLGAVVIVGFLFAGKAKSAVVAQAKKHAPEARKQGVGLGTALLINIKAWLNREPLPASAEGSDPHKTLKLSKIPAGPSIPTQVVAPAPTEELRLHPAEPGTYDEAIVPLPKPATLQRPVGGLRLSLAEEPGKRLHLATPEEAKDAVHVIAPPAKSPKLRLTLAKEKRMRSATAKPTLPRLVDKNGRPYQLSSLRSQWRSMQFGRIYKTHARAEEAYRDLVRSLPTESQIQGRPQWSAFVRDVKAHKIQRVAVGAGYTFAIPKPPRDVVQAVKKPAARPVAAASAPAQPVIAETPVPAVAAVVVEQPVPASKLRFAEPGNSIGDLPAAAHSPKPSPLAPLPVARVRVNPRPAPSKSEGIHSLGAFLQVALNPVANIPPVQAPDEPEFDLTAPVVPADKPWSLVSPVLQEVKRDVAQQLVLELSVDALGENTQLPLPLASIWMKSEIELSRRKPIIVPMLAQPAPAQIAAQAKPLPKPFIQKKITGQDWVLVEFLNKDVQPLINFLRTSNPGEFKDLYFQYTRLKDKAKSLGLDSHPKVKKAMLQLAAKIATLTSKRSDVETSATPLPAAHVQEAAPVIETPAVESFTVSEDFTQTPTIKLIKRARDGEVPVQTYLDAHDIRWRVGEKSTKESVAHLQKNEEGKIAAVAAAPVTAPEAIEPKATNGEWGYGVNGMSDVEFLANAKKLRGSSGAAQSEPERRSFLSRSLRFIAITGVLGLSAWALQMNGYALPSTASLLERLPSLSPHSLLAAGAVSLLSILGFVTWVLKFRQPSWTPEEKQTRERRALAEQMKQVLADGQSLPKPPVAVKPTGATARPQSTLPQVQPVKAEIIETSRAEALAQTIKTEFWRKLGQLITSLENNPSPKPTDYFTFVTQSRDLVNRGFRGRAGVQPEDLQAAEQRIDQTLEAFANSEKLSESDRAKLAQMRKVKPMVIAEPPKPAAANPAVTKNVINTSIAYDKHGNEIGEVSLKPGIQSGTKDSLKVELQALSARILNDVDPTAEKLKEYKAEVERINVILKDLTGKGLRSEGNGLQKEWSLINGELLLNYAEQIKRTNDQIKKGEALISLSNQPHMMGLYATGVMEWDERNRKLGVYSYSPIRVLREKLQSRMGPGSGVGSGTSDLSLTGSGIGVGAALRNMLSSVRLLSVNVFLIPLILAQGTETALTVAGVVSALIFLGWYRNRQADGTMVRPSTVRHMATQA